MEDGLSAYTYHHHHHHHHQYLPYGGDSSPATDSGSPPPMLAEFNPKKRAGRRKFKETRHPVYRGIRQRNKTKWVCEVREPNKKTRIWLGTYPTAEMAARAHDVAAIALRGRSACLNFADSAWRLPVPASANTKDIQRAAAEAAEAFRAPASDQAAAWEAASSSTTISSSAGIMDQNLFDEMPQLILADMYNGMMLPPPDCSFVADDYYVEYDADLPLWSY